MDPIVSVKRLRLGELEQGENRKEQCGTLLALLEALSLSLAQW